MMISNYKPILKNKYFIYLWLSQILSQVTINVMNFLLLIKLFERTGSSLATSFLWVSYAIPAIAIGPFASATVDILDRKKILIITNLLQAVLIFSFALLHGGRLFLFYGVAILYSFINQFYVPAESASLPGVVEKKNLVLANSLFFITQQSSLVFGFGVAGFLNQYFGFTNSLIMCSALLFSAFISVIFLPNMPVLLQATKSFETKFMNFFGSIFDGLKFIKNNNKVLLPFLILMMIQTALAIIIVNIPLLAKDIFHISINLAGIYIVVPAGIGTITAALVIPNYLRGLWRKKALIEASFMGLAIIIFVIIFIIPLITNVIRIPISLLLIFLSGFLFISVLIPAQTFLQEETPGGLRGRVFGNFWFIETVITIIPLVLSGAISEILGIKSLFFVLGTLCLFAVYFSRKIGQELLNGKSLLRLFVV